VWGVLHDFDDEPFADWVRDCTRDCAVRTRVAGSHVLVWSKKVLMSKAWISKEVVVMDK
jgi:hypothetical protein